MAASLRRIETAEDAAPVSAARAEFVEHPWAPTALALGAAAPAADVRWLRWAGAEHGLRYRLRRWCSYASVLWQPHRLRPQACGHYASRCCADAALRARFAALFDLRRHDAAPDYPFVYAQGVIDLLQTRVLADLGVNRHHVRLLRHRTHWLMPQAHTRAQAVQDVDCCLARVVQVSPTEVAALLHTGIADEGGRLLARVEDVFVVRDLPVALAVQAGTDDLLRRAISRMRRRTGEIDPATAGVRQRPLFVAADAGRRFAALGGGPLQRGRAPVAPMLLRHLVARELAEWGLDQSHLQMTFLAPVAPGRMLRLLLLGRSFELVDTFGRLAACGRI